MSIHCQLSLVADCSFIQIREARPQLEDRRLRLIQSGRLLTDGTPLYASLVISEERQQRLNTDPESSIKPSTTWIHCSVGPKTEKSDMGEDEKEPVRA